MKNVRYGVVNEAKRTKYEKKHQKPFRYEYIVDNIKKAIMLCRKKKNSNYIVEKIYDIDTVKNFKEKIYQSGTYEDWLNEKNN